MFKRLIILLTLIGLLAACSTAEPVVDLPEEDTGGESEELPPVSDDLPADDPASGGAASGSWLFVERAQQIEMADYIFRGTVEAITDSTPESTGELPGAPSHDVTLSVEQPILAGEYPDTITVMVGCPAPGEESGTSVDNCHDLEVGDEAVFYIQQQPVDEEGSEMVNTFFGYPGASYEKLTGEITLDELIAQVAEQREVAQ